MKEARTKILIIILTLFVVFDPSIYKITHGKEYLHSLFNEYFDEDVSNSTKKISPISIYFSHDEVVNY
jgi:hypothetical protein